MASNTVITRVGDSPSTRAAYEYAAWAAALLDSLLSLLHVLEKDAHPAVSDLTGSIGIDSQAHPTEELVKTEGGRSRLLMAQGKAILAGCAGLLNDAGHADVQLLQKRGVLDEILADLGDVHPMVLGRRGAQNPVGGHLERIIRLQKRPVLIMPEAYFTPTKVMFAYDDSNKSCKNLTRLTLSPLLNGLVCHIAMVKGDTRTLQEAQNMLQEAGITTESHILEGTSVADVPCRYANKNGINLIVIGAYGHPPLRQSFIGSNTTAMLEKTQIPFLMLR